MSISASSPPSLERRAYDEHSDPQQVQALRAQVYFYEPNIVMYKEAPVMSLHQLRVYHDKLDELAAQVDAYQMLIDITQTKGPNAEQRVRLKQMYGSQRNLEEVAVFTGKNVMINIVAKFVLSGLKLKSFSVHKTLEQAEKALRDAKNQR